MSSVRKLTESRAQDFANKRILLVDDHTHVRSIFTSILNGLGMFRLSTADRSDRALSTLQTEPIDLDTRNNCDFGDALIGAVFDEVSGAI